MHRWPILFYVVRITLFPPMDDEEWDAEYGAGALEDEQDGVSEGDARDVPYFVPPSLD